MDRTTGQSSGELSSVTIIADNATDADALATAVTVMGPEKGIELIESIPNTEAILMLPAPNFEIIQTTAAKNYIE